MGMVGGGLQHVLLLANKALSKSLKGVIELQCIAVTTALRALRAPVEGTTCCS